MRSAWSSRTWVDYPMRPRHAQRKFARPARPNWPQWFGLVANPIPLHDQGNMCRAHLTETRFAIPVLLLVTLLAGCRVGPAGVRLDRFEFQQPHMGTLFTITLYAPNEAKARAAADAAFARVGALDRMMTDYDPESELMQLCRRP